MIKFLHMMFVIRGSLNEFHIKNKIISTNTTCINLKVDCYDTPNRSACNQGNTFEITQTVKQSHFREITQTSKFYDKLQLDNKYRRTKNNEKKAHERPSVKI